MSWRGLFTGALALIALEAVVRSNESADRVGGALEAIADIVERVMSPAVAAIPDRSHGEVITGPDGNDTWGRVTPR